jgi:hypothetical protein
VHKILRWRHTGFNVHSQVRVRDKVQAERVGKYMIRPLLSLKRLGFDESEGCVCYSRFPSWPSGLGWVGPPPPHVVQQELLKVAEESKPLTVLICVWYIRLFTRVE